MRRNMKSSWKRGFAIGIGMLLLPTLGTAADLLSLVPENAVAVGLVRVDEWRENPTAGRLLTDTDRIAGDGEAARFMDEAGIEPKKDVDAILFAMSPDPEDAKEGRLLLVFEGRFDTARLSSASVSRGALPRVAHGRTYYLLPEDDESESNGEGTVAFVSSSLMFAGTETAVVEALGRLETGGSTFLSASGLGRDYRLVEPDATAWILFDVQRSARLNSSPNDRAAETYKGKIGPVVRKLSTVALWARGTSDALEFGATAQTIDPETRELIEDFLRGITAAWRMAAQEKSPEWLSAIRSIKVEQTGDGVRLRGSIPAALIEKQYDKVAAATP